MRGVTFAMALKNVCGDPGSALQSFNPDVRLFCLAAIAVVQKRPLFKAALLATGIDDRQSRLAPDLSKRGPLARNRQSDWSPD